MDTMKKLEDMSIDTLAELINSCYTGWEYEWDFNCETFKEKLIKYLKG